MPPPAKSLRPFLALAGLTLLAARAAAQVFPDSVHVDFGSLNPGSSLSSLYAVDGNPYSISADPEQGSGNRVGAFLCTFPIPAGTVSAVTHVTTSVSAPGCVLQGYLYKADGTVEYLGFRPLPSGTSTQEFPITGDQILRFRDAAGETRVQFRMFRPPSAGTGLVGWGVDGASVLLPIFATGGYEVEGNYVSGGLASLQAVDNGFYVKTSLKENGSGNQVASFVGSFVIPNGSPSASIHPVTGTNLPGAGLQVYVLAPNNGGGDFVGYAALGSGQTPVDMAVTSTQMTQYRDPSTGALLLHLRMFRPPASSSDLNNAAVTWSTDQYVVYPAPSNGPAFATGLIASAVSYSKIDLSWTDNANNETGYVVERKGGGDANFVQVGTAPADATVYHDSGLTASTAYTYRVKATNSSGDSPYSNQAGATTSAPPPPHLASLVLDRHNTLSSTHLIHATVRLSSAATSLTMVQLRSNDSDVTLPASVDVPPGQSSATFDVQYSSTPQAVTRAATVSAYLGNWAQKDDLEVLNPQATLAFSHFTAIAGDNHAIVAWDAFPAYTYTQVRVERRTIDPATGQVIATNQFTSQGSTYYDFTAANGSTYDYRVSVGPEADETPPSTTPWVRVVPISAGATLSWQTPPGSQAAPAQLTAQLSSSTTIGGMLVVDGNPQMEGGSGADSVSTSTIAVAFDPSTLVIGGHKVRLVCNVNGISVSTPEASTNVDPNTLSLRAQDLFTWGSGELDGVNLRLPSNSAGWQVDVLNGAGQSVRSWSGDGSTVSLAWDGKDASLQSGLDEDCRIVATVSTPTGNLAASAPASAVQLPPTALFLLNYVSKNESQDQAYADFLTAMCGRIHASNPNFRGRVLLRKKASSETENAIRKWMKTTVDCFYVQGHGGPLGYGGYGDQQFSAWAGGAFVPSQPMSIRQQSALGLLGPQYVISELVGNFSYRFAWMDTCNSGGGTLPPADGPIGQSSMNFHQAFGTLNRDNVVTIGWNGFDTLNYDDNGTKTGWAYWREYFWNLLEQGQTVDQALQNRTLISRLQMGPNYGRSPYDTKNGPDPNYPYGIVPRINYSGLGGTLTP